MKKFLSVVVLVLAVAFVAKASTDEPYGPVMVGKASFLAQTASIGSTTLVTPASDTGYIITGHTAVVGGFDDPQDNAGVLIRVFYMDTLGNSQQLTYPGNTGAVAQGATGDSMNYITVKGGTSVTFTATYQSGPHNAHYDIALSAIKVN